MRCIIKILDVKLLYRHLVHGVLEGEKNTVIDKE